MPFNQTWQGQGESSSDIFQALLPMCFLLNNSLPNPTGMASNTTTWAGQDSLKGISTLSPLQSICQDSSLNSVVQQFLCQSLPRTGWPTCQSTWPTYWLCPPSQSEIINLLNSWIKRSTCSLNESGSTLCYHRNRWVERKHSCIKI